jgi:hypothetical protein
MTQLDQPSDAIEQPSASIDATHKRGRAWGSSQLNSNTHTSISLAFKRVGLDWRENLAKAILDNDYKRIALWIKLLPYLVSKNHKHTKRTKGRASAAALKALDALENE